MNREDGARLTQSIECFNTNKDTTYHTLLQFSSGMGWFGTELFIHDFKGKKDLQWTSNSWGLEMTESPPDLLSHGIHEVLPLVLSPTKMPVHMELPTPSSSTGTYNKEVLVYQEIMHSRCSQMTTARCWGTRCTVRWGFTNTECVTISYRSSNHTQSKAKVSCKTSHLCTTAASTGQLLP